MENLKITEKLSDGTQTELRISDVMAMLPSDDKMEDLIRSRSQLYTSYSVKDKEGKYRSVVDIDSVIGLMRELLGN